MQTVRGDLVTPHSLNINWFDMGWFPVELGMTGPYILSCCGYCCCLRLLMSSFMMETCGWWLDVGVRGYIYLVLILNVFLPSCNMICKIRRGMRDHILENLIDVTWHMVSRWSRKWRDCIASHVIFFLVITFPDEYCPKID